ncbi:MAG: porin family protein [Prevotellaceae bacterium]|jgi:opacity protein-like surface antigen|nr:porin family protein [Prevotellaceae bacterium]
MKRLVLILGFMTSFASFAQAQDQEFRKLFLGLGLGANMVGDETFPYFQLNFGYRLSPKSQLALEFGMGSVTAKQIGSFTYGGGGHTYTDGKINYTYNLFAPSLSWSYFLGDVSKSVLWRVGPSIGVLQVTGTDSYTPTSKDGAEITGIPDPQSISKTAGVFGAHVGMTWNFARRWFLDLEYRLSANTGNLKFEERTVSIGTQNAPIDAKEFGAICNKITIGVGWRFGKP